MKHWKFRDSIESNPPNSMQLGQDTRPKPWWKLKRLKFATPISPNAYIKLIRIIIAADDRRGTFEIGRHFIRIGNGKRVGVQRDDGSVRDTKNPLVTAAPRVFNDQVTGEVLGLFRRRMRGRIGRSINGVHFLWRLGVGVWRDAVHRVNVLEVMEGVVTWRMLLTEKEPEVHSGMVVWSGGRSRVAVGLMRLIRPQFSNVITDLPLLDLLDRSLTNPKLSSKIFLKKKNWTEIWVFIEIVKFRIAIDWRI